MLSNSCRYGIRAVIYLARLPFSKDKTGISKISKDLDLPQPFLAKILQQLVKKKILCSTKGPHGGFALLKESKNITLLDIVTAIDGDDIFTNCVIHNSSCKCVDENKKACTLHDDYSKTRNNLISLFGKKTIYDLVKKANNDALTII
jgi:Rrf2 family iron-sulfur cluster assembly transcriptional regulator